MEDSKEIKVEPMYNHEDMIYEISADAERYQTKLSTKEFESHLDDVNYTFRDNVMSKVFMLKLTEQINSIEHEKECRVDALRSEMRTLEHECYEQRVTRETQESALKKEFDSRQRRAWLRKYFYALQDHYYAQKRAKKYNEEWCKKFREKNLLKMIVKYWKYFTFNQGNKAFEGRLKADVESRIQAELQDRRLVVEALEAAIKELESQKALEIKKKNIIKSQLDQAYLRGASSTSLNAIRMSQGTLNTLYSGVKMPRYNGQNLLAQINLLKDDSKTVTKKVIVEAYEKPHVIKG